MTAGIGPSFQTHGRMEPRTHGWTDRRGSQNSYLDEKRIELTIFNLTVLETFIGYLFGTEGARTPWPRGFF